MGAGSAKSAPEPQRPDLPTAGHELVVRVQCGHDGQTHSIAEVDGHRVRTSWTLSMLTDQLEVETRVHRKCQRLMFAWRTLSADAALSRIAVSDGGQRLDKVTLFMHVVTDKFPEKLGPFTHVKVPFQAGDFRIPKMTCELRASGVYWEMGRDALERHGLQAFSMAVLGQLSPIYPVTLSAEERLVVGIPQEAYEFAWSYPI